MAYIDDLDATGRPKRKPAFGGVMPTPDVNVTYGGQSPIDTNGKPNPNYSGNTGINGGKPPTMPKPPINLPKPPVLPTPVPVPPSGPQGAGGGTATPAPAPAPAPPSGPSAYYQQALDALYKKYFYRAPNASELQAHLGNLTTPNMGTLSDIEAELAREAARLQIKAPTTTTTPAPTTPAPYKRTVQNMPPGVDTAKWLSGHQSPKYAWKEVASSGRFNMRTEAGKQAALADLKKRFPQWYANATLTGDVLDAGGNAHRDWAGITRFDVLRDQEGAAAASWQALGGPNYVAPVAPGQPVTPGAPLPGGTTAPVVGSTGTGSTTNPPTPNQGALPIGPLGNQLGGAGGVDFGITGEYGYDDPNTRKLEEFLRLMIDEKTKPIDDPARDDYANALRQRFQSLIEPGSGTNDGAVDLDQQLQAAIQQLTNPALTENDRARLENRALEPMERDRQIRLQQETERLAARGLGESSGIITESLASVDRDYDRRRGEVQRDLSIYEREQDDVRRREALDYGTQRRNVIGTELDREQGRYGQALTMAEALSNLSGQQRGEQDARMREALTYTSLFPEMDERRLRLAMETLGMSNSMANTPSIFSTLGGLSAQANAAAQQGNASNAAFWGQMGSWMANAWPQDGGS